MYSKEQRELVIELISTADDDSKRSLLYDILRPTRSTIKRWMGETSYKNSFLQKACRCIRNNPYNIIWFVFELLLIIVIVFLSFLCLTIWTTLLYELNPQFTVTADYSSEVFADCYPYILLIALACIALSILFSYIYVCTNRKSRIMGKLSSASSLAFFILLIVYFAHALSLILNSFHPILLIIFGAFFATVIYTYIHFINSWKDPEKHDGYKSSLNLLAILALVLTMSTSVFSLLNGDSFPEKVTSLYTALGGEAINNPSKIGMHVSHIMERVSSIPIHPLALILKQGYL